MTEPPRWSARAEREAYGKTLRDRVRRVDQDRWVEGERDVLGRLRASEAGRHRDLLAVRHAKMAESPFGFLRGGAWVMAPDLAALPATGYHVQICGDAHVRNLGAYAAIDGRVVFDVNDFDETCRAPWEWELTRLAISLVVVGREGGASDASARDAVRAMVRTWRETLQQLADLPAVELARYCVHRFPPDGAVGRVLRKAERMTPVAALADLTDEAARPHFVDIPNKLRRATPEESAKVLAALQQYRETLGPNRQQVLDCYEPYDVAFKIAGTGSIGAKNYVVLCAGNGPSDPLILQVKQALPSCYEALGLVGQDPRIARHGGKRVAEGQHRMQTWADPFLGWTTLDDHPCYVRHLADHQGSIDPKDLKRSALAEYASVCGETFAKAHARTGDPAVLWGYAGEAEKLDRALAARAIAGADQVIEDWHALVGAIARGEVEAGAR